VRHDQQGLPEPEKPSSGLQPHVRNPDEIAIDEEEEEAGFDAPSGGAATVQAPSTASQNPDEITLEDEIETVEPPPRPPPETKFLALDKCLPRRQFLEASVTITHIPSSRR
jgi:lariat debranching enzyme